MMRLYGFVFIIVVLFVSVGLWSGCSSTPPPKKLTLSEQLQKDNHLGSTLSQRFEPSLKMKKDVDVTIYLRKIARKLMGANLDLKDSPVGVFLIASRGGRWRNYVIPGVRVYLSSDLIRQFEFENEVAAVIAFELAHVANRHLVKKIERLRVLEENKEEGPKPPLEALFPAPYGKDKHDLQYSAPGHAFYYTNQQILESIEQAVQILYDAGYDARGLASVWRAYQKNVKFSPHPENLLEQMVDQTYTFIVGKTPLRNPIVRTDEFIRMKKRIKKL